MMRRDYLDLRRSVSAMTRTMDGSGFDASKRRTSISDPNLVKTFTESQKEEYETESTKQFHRRNPSLRHCKKKVTQNQLVVDSSGYSSTSPSTSPRLPSRSASYKRPKQKNYDFDFEDFRPRTYSVPTKNQFRRSLGLNNANDGNDGLDTIPVRTFTLSSKGLRNRGDSFKRKSKTNINEVQGSQGGLDEFRDRTHSMTSQGSSNATPRSGSESSEADSSYRVVLLGSAGVGRTALSQQFLTSEYIGAFDTSMDDCTEKTVSVLLDGQESDIYFIDPPLEQDYTYHENADAFVIVYSVADRSSFEHSADLLFRLRKEEQNPCAIILVGNKSDIVRSRVVSIDEGKAMAKSYDCKFIETSAVLNHRVDELLVGTLSQIRLKEKQNSKRSKDGGCVPKAAKGLMKLLKKSSSGNMSKSCDNLYVL